MELPPSCTGWRQPNKIREKIQLLFRYFSFFRSCLHAKNLLWLNCHSRFFYKLSGAPEMARRFRMQIKRGVAQDARMPSTRTPALRPTRATTLGSEGFPACIDSLRVAAGSVTATGRGPDGPHRARGLTKKKAACQEWRAAFGCKQKGRCANREDARTEDPAQRPNRTLHLRPLSG